MKKQLSDRVYRAYSSKLDSVILGEIGAGTWEVSLIQ